MQFSVIYGRVCEAIGDRQQQKLTLVKEVINQVYLNEIVSCDSLWPLFWLIDFDDSLGSLAPMTITGVTAADPAVVSVVNTLSNGDIVSIYDVVGMVQLNNRTFQVASASGSDIELKNLDGTDIDSSAYTAYSSAGTLVHRGVTLTGMERVISTPKWHGEHPMARISIDDLEDTTRWWDKSTARPEKFFHRKSFASNAEINQLLWFRGADAAYDLRLWTHKTVSELSNDADVPMMPERTHSTIISGAITRLAETVHDAAKPDIWPYLYENGLEAIRQMNRAWWNEKGMPE